MFSRALVNTQPCIQSVQALFHQKIKRPGLDANYSFLDIAELTKECNYTYGVFR
jgi:hypothetical protein